MYCPRCASQSIDDAKFCRSCGANLEAVALALADQQISSKAGKKKIKEPEKEKTSIEKRSQGLRKVVEGTTMLGVSLFIGLGINLLNIHPDRMAVMGFWVVFFGWLAYWGVFSLASGLGAIVQAATMGPPAPQSQPDDNPGTVPDTDSLSRPALFPPPSVTEYTTESLGRQAPSSKHSG